MDTIRKKKLFAHEYTIGFHQHVSDSAGFIIICRQSVSDLFPQRSSRCLLKSPEYHIMTDELCQAVVKAAKVSTPELTVLLKREPFRRYLLKQEPSVDTLLKHGAFFDILRKRMRN